jgi:peptide/nickel transport system permease protein
MSAVGGEISGPPSGAQAEAESRMPMRVAAVGASVRGKFGANATLTIGLGLFIALALIGAFAGFFAPHDPIKQNVEEALLPPGSPGHLLGTDQLGRDTLSRLIYGARSDIYTALASLIGPLLIGTAIGIFAGYRGGWLDTVVVGVIDVIIAFPILVLLIALVFVLGAGITTIIIAVTVIDWVVYARLARTSARREAAIEYVMAARVGGIPTWRIIIRHILPNIITQSIVYAMSDMVLIIIFITTLGYLGLGVPPPSADWGTMISEAQSYFNNQWWLAVFPGAAIVITGFSLSLIADGLAQKLDVR